MYDKRKRPLKCGGDQSTGKTLKNNNDNNNNNKTNNQNKTSKQTKVKIKTAHGGVQPTGSIVSCMESHGVFGLVSDGEGN